MPAARLSLHSLKGGIALARFIAMLACAVLLGGVVPSANAAFPGTNGKIAFGWNDVYVVNSDGGGLTNLTPDTPDSFDGEPAWSPDGTKIAFASDRANGVGESKDIYVMNADGSNPVRLTDHPAFDEWPAWSPDGRHIVFSRGEPYFGGEILIMKADGSEEKRLVALTTMSPLTHPAWSPDGSLIAFVGPAPRHGWGIHLIKPDGTDRKRLTDPAGGGDLHPDWSPDGSKIVFSRRFGDEYFIWTMNADGSGLTPITSGDDEHPAWSPDGTRIVFERAGEESWDLWTMNPDGSGLTPVVQSSRDEVWPDWQPLP